MSAAAVLRSACRAFRGPSSPSPRALRRFYSSDNVSPTLNKGGYDIIPEAAAERMCAKLDKLIASYDRQKILLNQLEENMNEEHERRLDARGRRVLFAGAAIIVSIVVYVRKQHSKKVNNKATDHQEIKTP